VALAVVVSDRVPVDCVGYAMTAPHTAPALRPDPSEIERAVHTLFQPLDVVEMRVVNTVREGTVSGYFNDHSVLVRTLAARNDDPGIYYTINPVLPDLLARSVNRVKSRVKLTTADHDIVRRIWLPADFDPARPAGISATNPEHDAALERARSVRSVLHKEGWTEPVLADSGNGGHLLWRIDLANDEESAELIKAVLKALAERFDDERVKIDTSLHNAARIIKAYGTVSRKGDTLPARPHRLSRLLDVPPVLTPVPIELLKSMARSATRRTAPPPRPPYNKFSVEEWIRRHGLTVREPVAYDGGRKWVLLECPFDANHKAPDAAIFEGADGRPGFKCFHRSCSGNGWHELRARFEGPREQSRARASSSGAEKAEGRGPSHSVPPREPETPTPQWPAPLGKEALYGLAGAIVSLIEPQCESDQAALLAQVLVAVGNLTRGPHFRVGRTRHCTNEFIAIVGDTAKSRKGTGADWILDMFEQADPEWSSKAVAGGASTGEGLIEKLKTLGDEIKRLMLVESELARVLTSMGRDGNTLSMVMRQAWDKDRLETIVKTNAQKVEGAHLSVIGHITEDELRRKLTTTEAANGFANRFAWVCAKRSKLLPDGGSLSDDEMKPIVRRLRDVIEFMRKTGCTELKRNDEARALWHQIYGELSEGRFGLFGCVTNRAEAHVMRFACIYALLDLSSVIRIEHLKAALAFWKYALDSALYLWGDAIGDPVADEIIAALHRSPEGLTRTEISDLFSRHQTEKAGLALRALAKSGRVRFVMETTAGRPTERWFVL
jgi:Protein of unknown function (DUF3987)